MINAIVKDHYENVNYPKCSVYRLDQTKHEEIHISSFGGRDQKDLDYLVVGCGTIEANLVANINPESRVVGIDLSRNSLRVSKSIKRKFNQTNLHLFTVDVCEYECLIKFDHIIASGVIHHIPDVHRALRNISSMLALGGAFSGMVYSKGRPSYIRTLNTEFRERGWGVKEIKAYFKDKPNEFQKEHRGVNEEIADTWLHPYWVDYSVDELRDLLKSHFRIVEVEHLTEYKLKFEAKNSYQIMNGINY